FVAHDGGGNVSLLVDAANGALSASYDYDPFGNLLAMSGPFAEANPYRFSGKRVDAFTGLYDYGFRSYHPVAGRWLSRDPIGESGGFNLYGFVGNDPVNGVDVLGMIDWRDVGWFFRDFGSIGAEVVAQSAKNVGHGLVFGTYDLTHALQGKAAEIGYDIGSNGFYDVWYRFSERVYAEIDWWEDSLSSLSDPCYRKLFGESLWLDVQNNAKSYGTTTGTAALGNLTAAGLLKFGGISFKSPFTTTPVAEAALAESEALVQAEFEFAEQNLSGKLSDWSAPKTPLTVNEQTIAKALEGSTMTSPQGKVSLPAVERYVRRLEAGEVQPPIKVDGNVIVDGNHRYVAGRVFGTEPPTTPGTLSPSQAPRVKPIQETVVDPADWGNK
ncbi:MAG: RHS repeat-associated core domain-containing protein, partial [Verrucomicrobiae bacterium]|nr:RHS repeat-associated core domain-containing protein [Verrucomicrobiae bacterium]